MPARTLTLSMAILGAIALVVAPAHADVTGGCDGQAVIDGVTYTPANDSADNAIIVPDAAGVVVPVEGFAPFDNNGHAGEMRLHLGPATVRLAEWADDNGELPNQNQSSEVYELDDLRAELPVDVRGLYRVSGTHSATGGSCEGFVMLKFDGPVLSSAVAQATSGLLVLALILVVAAAFARTSLASDVVRGRRRLGTIAGLLLGLSTAVLLQQFSVWPLDNLTTIGLPLLVALLGFALATWAPLGRARLAVAGGPGGALPDDDADPGTGGPPEVGEAADDPTIIEIKDEPTPTGGPLLVGGTDPCAKLRARIGRQGEQLEEAEKVRQQAEERAKELEEQLEDFERRNAKQLEGERIAGGAKPMTEIRDGIRNDLGTARDFAGGLLERVTKEEFEKDLERLKECEKRAALAAAAAASRSGSGTTPGGSRPEDDEDAAACCPARSWVGINIYLGGVGAIWGRETGFVFLWCTSDRRRSAVIQWQGTRWGPGLGGEVSAALFVLRGPRHPSETPLAVAGVLAGWDWDISVGLSLRKFLGTAFGAAKSRKVIKELADEVGTYLRKGDARVLTGNKAAVDRAKAELRGIIEKVGPGDTIDKALEVAGKGATSGVQAGGAGANIPIPALPTAAQIGLWKLTSVQTTLFDLEGCQRCDASVAARPV